MKKQIVLFLYPGCIFNEVALALELLAQKFEILPSTPDGSDHVASNGLIISVKSAYSEINLKNCAAILVPGGNPKSVKDNEEMDELLVEANAEGLLLAAICAGPFVLAKAGVLKGKKIAHGYDQERLDFLRSYFEGVILTDLPVVKDGNVLTAKPEAFIDFAVDLSTELGAVEAANADLLKRYYKGLKG
ncbi:MAG: DJ-1/PfpI family protein [Bdellovibrionota bacterium]